MGDGLCEGCGHTSRMTWLHWASDGEVTEKRQWYGRLFCLLELSRSFMKGLLSDLRSKALSGVTTYKYSPAKGIMHDTDCAIDASLPDVQQNQLRKDYWTIWRLDGETQNSA